MKTPLLRALETPRLSLRVCRPEDTDAVFVAEEESAEELRKWFWWMHPEHDREHCAAWAKSREERWLEGEEFSFLIIEKANDQIAGCIWLNAIDRISLRASLGYWLRTGRKGKGFATESAVQVCKWGFEELGLQRIEIVIALENKPSCQLAERIGARFEGVARNRLRLGGLSQDARVYSLLPHEVR
jgi:RimJ/RimL family protein N-acetyltransferase